MKASVKLRPDERKPPLLRFKLPISILGVPLISSAAAGDPSDLSVHLRTALPSGGPSLKLTFRPSPLPGHSPFSLSLTSGAGRWGSPVLSPLLISAHFSLPSVAAGGGGGAPSFTIQLKPQIGDFTLRMAAASPPPYNPSNSYAVKENGGGGHHPLPFPQAGVDGLLTSGATVSATTTLPVAHCAALKLRWGVNFSEAAVAGMRRLPYLTVEKISVEGISNIFQVKKKEEEDPCVEGMGLWMRKEMEKLRRENAAIKESIEQVRAMVRKGSGDGVARTRAGGNAATTRSSS